MTRSPAALTVPVVFPLMTKCKSLPCVIYIIDHVIRDHVLLSATPNRPKSGKCVQCALHLTLQEQGKLEDYIKENLEKGYVRPSKSQYSSPFFFVRKKDGKLRPV